MTIKVKEIETVYKLNDDNEFECQHIEKSDEDIEVPYFHGEADMTYTVTVEVCDECGREFSKDI